MDIGSAGRSDQEDTFIGTSPQSSSYQPPVRAPSLGVIELRELILGRYCILRPISTYLFVLIYNLMKAIYCV